MTDSPRPFVEELRAVMTEYRSPGVADLPRFTGGAVGYLGYDSAPWFEPTLKTAWSRGPAAEEGAADEAAFMLFDTVLAFDHVKHRILLIANARVGSGEPLESLYQFACAKIQFLERELERALSRSEPTSADAAPVSSNVTQEAFEEAVRRAKTHIAAGDVFQVVLSQRFRVALEPDAFAVYRALRYINPSPYIVLHAARGHCDCRLFTGDADPGRGRPYRDAPDCGDPTPRDGPGGR